MKFISQPRPIAAMGKAAHAALGDRKPPKHVVYENQRPQPQPLRAIAEYEPMGGVLIAYPGVLAPASAHVQRAPHGQRDFGIPDELIVRMQQNDSAAPVHVFVMCADAAARAEIDTALGTCATRLGLRYDPAHLHLVPWDTDTFWTRDFGPWWTVLDDGRHAIAKHTYTTLGGGSAGLVEGAEHVDPREGKGIFRPNDDYGAVAFSDFLNAPVRAWNEARWPADVGESASSESRLTPLAVHDWFYTGLLDVGGNYMVTSNGLVASSYLVATQNELPNTTQAGTTDPTPKDIVERMNYILDQLNRFMGIERYCVLTDPTGTYIGHIDCWGKFLSDDTILIANSKHELVREGLDSIADFFVQQGFRVQRVLTQDVFIPGQPQPATSAAYTNSLILNDHVYVPLAGDGYEVEDEAALDAYRKAMPTYCVVGIRSKPEFPWLGTDAMHCRTRGVPRAVVDTWLKSLRPPTSADLAPQPAPAQSTTLAKQEEIA